MNRHSHWAPDLRPFAIRILNVNSRDRSERRSSSGATLAPPLALLLLLLRPRPSLCSLPLHVFSEQLVTLLRRQVCIHRT